MQRLVQVNRVGEEDTAVAPEGDAAAEVAALVVPSATGIDCVEEGTERARLPGQGRGGMTAAIRRSAGISALLLAATGCVAVAAMGATRPHGRRPDTVAGGGVVASAVEMNEQLTGFLPLSEAPAPAPAKMRAMRINATAVVVVAVNRTMPLNATRLNASAMVAAANTSERSNESESSNDSESSNESESSNATAIVVVAVNRTTPLNATRLNASVTVAAVNTSESSNESESSNATAVVVVAANRTMPPNATRLNASAMVAAANTSESSNESESSNATAIVVVAFNVTTPPNATHPNAANTSNESETSNATAIEAAAVNGTTPLNATRLNASATGAAANASEGRDGSGSSNGSGPNASANTSSVPAPHRLRAVPINATHVLVVVPDTSMLRHTDTAGTGITAHRVNSSAVILGVEGGALEVEVVNGTSVKFTVTGY